MICVPQIFGSTQPPPNSMMRMPFSPPILHNERPGVAEQEVMNIRVVLHSSGTTGHVMGRVMPVIVHVTGGNHEKEGHYKI